MPARSTIVAAAPALCSRGVEPFGAAPPLIRRVESPRTTAKRVEPAGGAGDAAAIASSLTYISSPSTASQNGGEGRRVAGPRQTLDAVPPPAARSSVSRQRPDDARRSFSGSV